MSSEYRDPFWVRHPIMAFVVIPVALLIAASVAGWGLKVALSPVKGAGDVIIEQNDATNMINAQRELVQRYEGLKAACARIAIAKAAADRDPSDYVAARNHTAAQTHYQTDVATYNALTQQLLAANMLGDLPQRVNPDNCDGVK